MRRPFLILGLLAIFLVDCGGDGAPAPPTPAAPCSPQVVPGPPTGKIAFHSNRDGNLEIYVMNADGSGQT